MKNLKIHLFIIFFLISSHTYSQWSQDPSADTRILLGSFFIAATSDGYGGAIIIGRRDYQFTAQRVDQNGYVLWDPTLQGLSVVIPDSVNDMMIGRETYLWPNGKGGVYIAYDYFDYAWTQWYPEHRVIYDIDSYLQYLDNMGKMLWGNKGISLSTIKSQNPIYAGGCSEIIEMGADGHGGIIAIWNFL